MSKIRFLYSLEAVGMLKIGMYEILYNLYTCQKFGGNALKRISLIKIRPSRGSIPRARTCFSQFWHDVVGKNLHFNDFIGTTNSNFQRQHVKLKKIKIQSICFSN